MGMFPIYNPYQSFQQGLLTAPELQKSIVQNKLLQQQLQQQQQLAPYAVPEEQAKLAGMQAATKKALMLANNPLLSTSGAAAQIGALLFLKQHPELFGTSQIAQGQSTSVPVQPTPTPSIATSPQLAGSKILGSPVGSDPMHGSPSPQPNINTPSLLPGQETDTDIISHMLTTPKNSQFGLGPSGMLSPSATPTPNDYIQALSTSIFDNVNKTKAMTDYYGKRAQAYNWMTLPIDQKSAFLAQAAGMGYDQQQAEQMYMNGYTISDMAKAKGLDPSNLPESIYPLSKGALELQQKKNQALAEINSLTPILTAAYAPYVRQFAGYSPRQISEAISGKDEDSQAKILAARFIQPEMQAMRFRALQGQVGIEAIKDLQQQSLGQLKVFQPLVSPKVYSRAMQYLDQWINIGINAANKVGTTVYSKIGQQQAGQPQATSPYGVAQSQWPTQTIQTPQQSNLAGVSTAELIKIARGG